MIVGVHRVLQSAGRPPVHSHPEVGLTPVQYAEAENTHGPEERTAFVEFLTLPCHRSSVSCPALDPILVTILLEKTPRHPWYSLLLWWPTVSKT